MRNIKLTLAFDGTGYAGWQRQKEQPSIQGTVEEALTRMVQHPVTLHGAGRTDAGVHALGMVAHFLTASSIDERGFGRGLNSILSDAIRVLDVSEVEADFHARFSARGKSYEYHFVVGDILLPTERLYACLVPAGGFNLNLLAQCLPLIEGEHDFSSFEATGSRDLSKESGRGAVRTIFSAEIHEKLLPGRYKFIIQGDGFLRHMVRNLVGTLWDVARGKLTVEQFQEIVAAKDRTRAGATAPAQGLFLKRVFY